MQDRVDPLGMKVGLGASLFIILIFGRYWLLKEVDADRFYTTIQEDGMLEWVTFWAFLLAGIYWIRAAIGQRRNAGKIPWFLAGVALFCFFVALEEISWGQRVFGYRPPAYFLEENSQQEFNIHNVTSTSMRKLVMHVILLGYGVVLALLTLIPRVRGLLDKLAIVAPPLSLVPAFAATSIGYAVYPFSHAGEIIELMMGLAFLFAAVGWSLELRGASPGRLKPVVLATLIAVALGGGAAFASASLASPDPARLAEAQREVDALAADCRALYDAEEGALVRMRSLHKRLYTYVGKYDDKGADALDEGTFSKPVEVGLPQERADYYLDPWNSPYWIGKDTTKDKRYALLMVYSFGPNRRRDSGDWSIGGDDVGVIFAERGERPADLKVDVD